MLGVRRCHLVSIALLALATTAGAQSSDNSGPRTDLALQDAIARALARNLDISVERLDQQVIEVARINRDIADIDLRQTIANTVSSVQNAYWDLVHTTQTVAVQQQRLEWAETLVRENEARVEAGTLDPIQTVQARAEAAVLRQILAEAQQHLAIEAQVDVIVLAQRGVGREHEQAAGHAEVHHQPVAAVERDDQILASPVGGGNGLARQPRVQPVGHRPAQPTLAHHHLFDTAPENVRRDAAPDGLDLGQFRHGQPGVSSTAAMGADSVDAVGNVSRVSIRARDKVRRTW